MAKKEDKYYIIDSHAHIFPQKIAEKATKATGDFYDIPMNNIGNVPKLLESGKQCDVRKYVVHSTATTPHQVSSINDYISAKCAQHPEFIGFGTMHPSLSIEEQKNELDRFADLGLVGIKLHPDFQRFSLNCKESLKMFELIEGRFPVLIHMGDSRYKFSNPHKLVDVLEKFPNIDVIGAHLGGYSEWEESKKHLVGKNLYFDTSSSMCLIPKEETKRIIDAHGVDKICWGSDFPMWKHLDEYKNLLGLGYSHEINQKIFSGNIINLLKKYNYLIKD